MHTTTNLNLSPLGSYNMLLGMHWLFIHRTKVEFYEKVIECLDGYGEKEVFQGKKKPTLERMVTTIQSKCSRRKGCFLFALHVSSD